MKASVATTTRSVGWSLDVSGETPFASLAAMKYDRDSTLVLVDGRGMAYRAYHARAVLQSSTGVATGALYGMLETLSLLLEAANTSRVLVSWDGSVAYKRSVFPGYKSRHDRDRTPEEQAEHDRSHRAIDLARKTLDLVGVPSVYVPKIETDDAIGIAATAIAKLAVSQKDRAPVRRVLVVADDKDYYQLIRPDVSGYGEVLVWRTGYSEAINYAEMLNRTGLRPDQWADFKALVGEPATGDNIPGVPKIGEKTATRLIATHGDLLSAIDYAKKAAKSSKPKPSAVDISLASSEAIALRALVLSRIATQASDLLSYPSISPADVRSVSDTIVGAIRASLVPRSVDARQLHRLLATYEITSLPVPTLARRLGFSVTGV